jgi:membrane protein YqaA with SNARE-associated domain
MSLPLIGEELGLSSLFLSSFVSATLFPGGSEVVLFGLLKLHPQLIWAALLTATLGNTLGGMTSYLAGRLLPRGEERHKADWLRRWGSPALLLSWLPVVGDGLCVAAGWLRLNPWHAALFMGLGKAARYALIAQAA